MADAMLTNPRTHSFLKATGVFNGFLTDMSDSNPRTNWHVPEFPSPLPCQTQYPPPPPPTNPPRHSQHNVPAPTPPTMHHRHTKRRKQQILMKGSLSFNGKGHVFVPALTKIVVVPPKTTASGTPVNKIRLLLNTTEQPEVGGIHDTSFCSTKLPRHFSSCGKCPVPTYLVYHLCVHACTCAHTRAHTHILFTFRIIFPNCCLLLC